MNRRRGGLGSGLDALLPSEPAGGLREVAIASIKPNPRQPRTVFDEQLIDDLAASIREHGIIQPLVVSTRGADNYELIAGERRWRAAQRAGLERVPVIVRETSPQQLLELALIENVQRADLSPIEEALAYRSLKEEFGLSDDQIAKRVGKNTREAVANTRRLLDLHPDAQEALLRNQISAGHGRALLKLKQIDRQAEALGAILDSELNVREAERLADLIDLHAGDVALAAEELRGRRNERQQTARAPKPAARPAAPEAATQSSDDAQIGREMERILGTPVKLLRSGAEVRITISFYTEEKLQEFFDLLNDTRAG
ncbi:MAG TPA: ParB/RepB/Spo0J family partition protein [Roseiflexaceae bacterium]|nr:ParB/RepB/Spo0J family partition protein [Roseiflexaceae bacterium]